MKILHVIPSVASVRGGPSKGIIAMVKASSRQGIHTELITTNDNGPDVLDVPLMQRTNYEDIPVIFFPKFLPKISAIREYTLSSSLTQWLWQHIDEYELLHVHAVFSYVSTVSMIIARFKNIPYIIRPAGMLCNWALNHRSFKKKFYLSIVEKSNINGSKAIHYISDKEKQEAESLALNSPNFVLPYGLNLAKSIPDARLALRHQLNIPADEPIVLFMGRLHPVKGLDYLIPALAKISNQKFSFIVAGSGDRDYEKYLQQMIADVGINNFTYSLGFVTGNLKNMLLQGSDIFVAPSHQENFGVAVLEAMSTGLCVITSPGVALSSMIKQHKAGYVCDQDSDAIANIIQYCLEHPEIAQATGQNAIKVVEKNYTWEAHTTRLEDIYNKIINK